MLIVIIKQHALLLQFLMLQVFSIAPKEGISVLFDPSTSDEDVLPRYGVTTQSLTKV